MTTRRRSAADSRARLLDAASVEFATHGFAGASVDRLARRARLNKAMIYYHFGSKLGLYREILRDMYRRVGARVETARLDAPTPAAAIERFVAAMVDEASRHPYFPRVMIRELADHARHLDDETIRLAVAIPHTLAAIIAAGVAEGRFQPANPALTYFSIVGPLIVFFVSKPLRARVTDGPIGAIGDDIGPLGAHIAAGVLASLERPVGEQPSVDARPVAGVASRSSRPAARPVRSPR
ncbi:MAG: TetR/AcrR family transcriptional regulator [Vicinamibacterales bacterium]